MDEDIQSVVDTGEQIVEQSVDTYEDQAREQGWKPREKNIKVIQINGVLLKSL
jgi:hypothetical protein